MKITPEFNVMELLFPKETTNAGNGFEQLFESQVKEGHQQGTAGFLLMTEPGKEQGEMFQVEEKGEVVMLLREKTEEEIEEEVQEAVRLLPEILFNLMNQIKKEQPGVHVEKTETPITNEVVVLSKSNELIEKRTMEELKKVKQVLEQLSPREVEQPLKGKEIKEQPVMKPHPNEPTFTEKETTLSSADLRMATFNQVMDFKQLGSIKEVSINELKEYVAKEIDTTIEMTSVSPRKMVIQLNPDNLGKVEIILEKTADGAIVARFNLQEATAKEFIEKAMEEMHSLFEEKGTEFTFDVQTLTSEEEDEPLLEEENKKKKTKEEDENITKDSSEFEEALREV